LKDGITRRRSQPIFAFDRMTAFNVTIARAKVEGVSVEASTGEFVRTIKEY
jgi:hypothetical protein